MGKKIVCTVCNGSGTTTTSDGRKQDCWACGGSGERDIGYVNQQHAVRTAPTQT